MVRIEFDYYQGMWRIEKSVKITTPNPTQGEINKLRQKFIKNITNKIAGKEISHFGTNKFTNLFAIYSIYLIKRLTWINNGCMYR